MARYYKRIPVKPLALRVLARSEDHPNNWAWIRPNEPNAPDLLPVIQYEDGPYLVVKF